MAVTKDEEKPVDPEEVTLSMAACAGDARSFNKLFARWKPGLTAYVRGEVRASEQEVEEIVGDCLLIVFEKAGRLKEPAKLKGYTFGIARNLARIIARKAGRRGQEALDEEGERISPEEGAAEDPDPEVCANDQQFDARYGAAVRELPTVEAEVFVLRARYGRSDEEIAKLLGVGLPEIKRILQRARDKVRLRMRMVEE